LGGQSAALEKLAREGLIDLGVVFDRLPTPFMVLDKDFIYVGLNQAYLDVTSRTRDSILGRHILDAFPSEGDSQRLLIESLERARTTGRTDELPLLEYAIPRPEALGGGFEQRYWSVTHTPIPDDAGVTEFIVQHTQDVTELHNLRNRPLDTTDDHAALRQNVLRRAEVVQAEGTELRRLFNSAPGFMAILRGPDHIVEWHNAAYAQLVGRGDLTGRRIWDVMPDIAAQGYSQLLDSVFTTREPFVGRGMRVMFERAVGAPAEEHFLDFVYQPVINAEGDCDGIFVQGNDVTDSVRANERQRLLLNELNHRVKNTLATVQAILGQTLKSSSAMDFATDLQARIQGLAKTHEVLTHAEWMGADLAQLLRAELAPYGETHFSLEGPDLTLAPKSALALGLVFHELATNAAKYGALSQGEGKVGVSWTIDTHDQRPFLMLNWIESDGPKVKPPASQGFGSRLIERSLKGELGGDAELSYQEEGFRCSLKAPLEPLNV
jgi:two-component sensor histidine kinase